MHTLHTLTGACSLEPLEPRAHCTGVGRTGKGAGAPGSEGLEGAEGLTGTWHHSAPRSLTPASGPSFTRAPPTTCLAGGAWHLLLHQKVPPGGMAASQLL